MTRLSALAALLVAVSATANPLAELKAAAAAGKDAPAVRVPHARPSPKHPGHDDGRETAAQACSQAAFDSDRQECIRIVSQARWFDVNAVGVCRRVNFSSEVPQCIGSIANKSYLRAETDLCAKESFGSGIVRCLQNSGRPARDGGRGDAYTVRQLPPDLAPDARRLLPRRAARARRAHRRPRAHALIARCVSAKKGEPRPRGRGSLFTPRGNYFFFAGFFFGFALDFASGLAAGGALWRRMRFITLCRPRSNLMRVQSLSIG